MMLATIKNQNKPLMLRRRGRKDSIVKLIVPHFPKHKFYVEMFFGAGGMFFNKPLAMYNFLNDNNKELFNFWRCFTERNEDLIAEFVRTPLDQSVLTYWSEKMPECELMRAVRFLVLSNCALLGSGSTLRMGTTDNPKDTFLENAPRLLEKISRAKISCGDFREFLPKIGWINDGRDQQGNAFIYADPPYLGTKGNYECFSECDTRDLFGVLLGSGIRFALSEFYNPSNTLVTDLATDYGLNIIYLKSRKAIKKVKTEVLITNYKNTQMSLFEMSEAGLSK